MVKKNTIFIACLCVIFAGQMLAGNTEKRPVSKYVNVFSRKSESFGKFSQKRTINLRSPEESPAAPVQLRSTLEPGHEKPDSAININVYYGDRRKSLFSYDKDLITETIFDWEEGDWSASCSTKEEYAFDAYGNQTLYILYEYDEESEIYYGEKKECAYNPNGTPLYEKKFAWENGQWTSEHEQIYEYDNNGMLTGMQFTMEGEDYPVTVTGTPENLELTIFSGNMVVQKLILHYDPATMKLMGQEIYSINMETGELGHIETSVYTYDTAGRTLTVESTNEEYASKIEYVYNSNGQKLSVTESFSENGGPFVVGSQKIYEYANDKLVKISLQDWDEDKNAFELYDTTEFYYPDDSGNEQVTLTDVSVYPNPVTDILIIANAPTGATLIMTDMSGRMLFSKTLVGGQETLSVASLPAGYCIVTIQSVKGTVAYKIIKK